MPKRLPLLTVVLVGLSIAFGALIVKELNSAPPARTSRPQPAASVAATGTPPAPAASSTAPGGAGSYAVIASRNLFSPTRTEAPPPPPVAVAPPPAPVLPKPNLFGVVLQDKDGAPVAYLEDPVSKRVARYRVGDNVAGGTVKTIGSDTVMLLRPEGEVTVRLHDPTRPKPAAPAQPTPTPTPGARPTPPIPQVTPEGRPSSSITTPRRPLVPGVLGRIPPTDAAPSQ